MAGYLSRATFKSGQEREIIKGEEYDFYQEIARSSYGDMLHDSERNELYELALSEAIQKMHNSGMPANVLDIGTGTGLLSMMAVRHGADRVVACEGFAPIAECAEKVLDTNEMGDRIQVIPSMSYELTANDIGGRANILVAEVFDTELIGEGAIRTFRHALKELLEPDHIVIPHRAYIIAQPVSCPFFGNWNKFKDMCLEDHSDDDHRECQMYIRAPMDAKSCPGLNSVHDVQLDSLNMRQFTSFSEPQVVTKFHFNGEPEDLHSSETHQVQFVSTASGKVDCVFMWWELIMDEESNIIISNAPYWAHSHVFWKQWRDHWMQAVYCQNNPISVMQGEQFTMIVGHDEFSFWFNVRSRNLTAGGLEPFNVDRNCCQCGLHFGCNRTRLAALNNPKRNQILFRALKKVISSESVCLSFSDYSLLPIMAAMLGARKIFVVQAHCYSHFMEKFIESNNIENGKIEVTNSPLDKLKLEDFQGFMINTIIGEPYFSNSTLPWEDINFIYIKDHLAKVAKNYFSRIAMDDPTKAIRTKASCGELILYSKKLNVLPHSAIIRGVAVEFEDLHKVKGSPVGSCQGFDVSPFDDVIYQSSQLADSCIECHPLWEYPCTALSPIFELLQVNLVAPFASSVRQQERDGFVDFDGYGSCNGIAMWVDYVFDDNPGNMTIFNGPTSPIVSNQTIHWNEHSKQGVFFLSPPQEIAGPACRLKHKTSFHVKEAKFTFEFEILDLKLI